MAADRPFPIAVVPQKSACESAEAFALMVLGDSMLPEFEEGEIILIEPEGVARDGSYVLAMADGEYIFRQLRIVGGNWQLHALQPGHPVLAIPGPDAVKGVIIQKKKPGRRRAHKAYV